MVSSRVVGAGAFVVLGLALFTAALFMIGERRMLFEDQFVVYTEFAELGQLQPGAVVRVAGMNAGEVTVIETPRSPDQKFRVRMEVLEDLRPLIRTDSVASTQTEGLVGAIFVNIATGSTDAPEIEDEGTIPSQEPFTMADLVEQASDAIALVRDTVERLSGDIEMTVRDISETAEQTNALVEEITPDIVAIADSGAQISADTQNIIAGLRAGEGTLGKFLRDDALYDRAREIADEAKGIMDNVREVSEEARAAIADFRSEDGPAAGLAADVRVTLSQTRAATAALADNMEALRHNFLLRGFFNRRGYFDLDAISPAEYRNGVLENGDRRAMRIWLGADVLFEEQPDGGEALTEAGELRLDSAMAPYLEYLPTNPLVVEGYATEGTAGERFRASTDRARIVREYLIGRYALTSRHTGSIALGAEAPGSPAGGEWDGVALTLFLDTNELQFVNQGRP